MKNMEEFQEEVQTEKSETYTAGKSKLSNMLQKFYRFDIYLTMIVVLSMLAAINILSFGVMNTLPQLVIAVVVATATEALWDFYRTRTWKYSKSAIITGLFIGSLLDPSQVLYIPAVAALIAFLAKTFIRAKARHFFNPTMLSMFAVALLFKTSLGWWAATNMYATIILGLFISVKFKRLSLTLPFLATAFVIILLLTQSLTSAENLIMSAPILYMVFFMLVEPKTSPFSRRGRLIYGPIVAILLFVMGFVLAQVSGMFGIALDTIAVTLLVGNVIAWVMNWKMI